MRVCGGAHRAREVDAVGRGPLVEPVPLLTSLALEGIAERLAEVEILSGVNPHTPGFARQGRCARGLL